MKQGFRIMVIVISVRLIKDIQHAEQDVEAKPKTRPRPRRSPDATGMPTIFGAVSVWQKCHPVAFHLKDPDRKPKDEMNEP